MEHGELTERTLESRQVYAGVIVNVRLDRAELANGARVRREVVEHPGGVAVAAVDGDGRVYLVRQYRYPAGKTLLEIPAGKLERGEDPAAAALRELGEETGLIPGELIPLAALYATPGYCDELLHLYLALELTPGKDHPDPNELLAVERLPLAQALSMAERGALQDAKTVAALYLAQAQLLRRGLQV